MNTRSFLIATAIGLVLQLAMVVAGHFVPPVRERGFAIGGMAISFVAGLIYGRLSGSVWSGAFLGGAVSGGLCAAFAIALSVMLGDVPALILAVGTTASAATGLVGGAAGKLLTR